MKRRKRFLTVIICLSILMAPTLRTYAGAGTKVVDTTSYKTQLDAAQWYNADDDITAQNGVILFPDDSSSATKLISNTIVTANKQINVMLSVEFVVNFTHFPEGQRFVFAIGLQSLNAELSQKGNIELSFSNDGGAHKAAVSAFAEDGVEEQLVKSVSCGNGDAKIQIEVSTNQTMKVTIGNKKVYDGNIPVTGEGSVGFLQTGSCGAEIREFVMKSYVYDTPECPDFEEDFETGYFNANLLLSKMIGGSTSSPSRMTVTDYNGSKVLMFQNTGVAYIGTKYAYSNFELTFDVPFMQRTTEYDEEGNIEQPASREFGLAYGSDGIDHTHEGGYTTATDMFCINGVGGGYCLTSKENIRSGLKDPTKDAPFSVRLTVIDGVVSLGMKLQGDASYKEAVTYKLDTTPTGNVIIWAPTGGATTFAIDNIKMVNKDVDGKVIEVEYRSSEIIVPDDFKYEPLELTYNSDNVSGDVTADLWYRPVLIVAGVCLFALGITVVIRTVKARKRKVGAVDEE